MVSLLSNRTWRDLRAVSGAYGLPFHTRKQKQFGFDRLYRSLIGDGLLRKQLKQLKEPERRALEALQAAGGRMPLHRFKAVFGELRRWQPWREDGKEQFWKQPQSVTERLWYLGMIELPPGKSGDVVLPEEVQALLPPLPHPAATAAAVEHFPRDTVCIDLAHLLGVLLYEPVQPIHGRWIAPTLLRKVNERLLIQGSLQGKRSELQSGRLRFLHYLAEAAGLVAVQGGLLKPTVTAWCWLRLAPDARWSALWEALNRDVRQGRLWTLYRLPETSSAVWLALIECLKTLSPGLYPMASLVDALRPYLPGVDDLEPVVGTLLREPLVWMGVVESAGSAVMVKPPVDALPQPARLAFEDNEIEISLPPFPHLHALVSCCAWAKVEHGRITISASTVADAVERGVDGMQIATALADLIGAPLPSSVFEQLVAWERTAHALTLRSLTVLTAHDPEAFDTLRADWRLRPLLGEPLSPHHLVVRTEQAETLLKALERRGCRVTNTLSAPEASRRAELTPELASYFWLAARVYQKLGAFMQPDIPLPAAARRWLENSLPEGRAAALEAEATHLIEKLAASVKGIPTAPAPVRQENPEQIRGAVQQAYERRGALTIEYFSPARGEKTIRTIEPVMLYERQGATYVEAWCRLDEDTRTFRVDRIVRVLAG